MKKVAVIIPCRNERNYISRCISSIAANSYDKASLEVIVCDGLSDDGTPALLEELSTQYPFVKCISNQSMHTPAALNLGINSCPSADIIIIFGAHAEMDPEYIRESVSLLERDDIDCVGGVIENVCENKTAEVIAHVLQSPLGVGNAYFRTGTREGFVDTVAFGAYKREKLMQCGLFDEVLVRNQDDELNYRFTKAGFRIYLSRRIKSSYYVRSSLQKLSRQYYQYGYWKVYVNKKHKTITTLRQLVPLAFVVFILTFPLISILFHWYAWVFSGTIIFYLTACAYSISGKSKKISTIFSGILCFPLLHLSYGWGYLHGIVRFILLNKNPAERQMRMSR